MFAKTRSNTLQSRLGQFTNRGSELSGIIACNSSAGLVEEVSYRATDTQSILVTLKSPHSTRGKLQND